MIKFECMRKNIFKFLLSRLVFCLVIFVFNIAKINPLVNPFALAFTFAYSCYAGGVTYPLCYLLGTTLALRTLESVVFSTIQVILLVVINYVGHFVKPRVYNIVNFVCLLLAMLPQFFLWERDYTPLLVASVLSTLAVYYLFRLMLKAYFMRGLRTTYVIDEEFSLLMVVFALFFGLKNIEWHLDYSLLFFLPVALYFSNFQRKDYVWIASLGFCVACFVGNENLAFIIYSILLVVFLQRFCYSNKFLKVVISSLLFIVVNLCLNNEANFKLNILLSFTGGVLLYLIVPSKYLFRLNGKFEYNLRDNNELQEFIAFSNSEGVKKISDLLYSIDEAYKEMVIPVQSYDKSLGAMSDEVLEKTCKKCVNFKICKSMGLEKNMLEAVKIANEKKVIKIFDLPRKLAKCSNYTALISQINYLISNYGKLKKEVEAQNESKVVIGNQMRGVAEVLDKFCQNLKTRVRANRKYEIKFIENMLYNGILIKDCIIEYDQFSQFERVFVMMPLGVDSKKFVMVAENFLKCGLKIATNKFASNYGFQVVCLERRSRLGFVYGSATMGANKQLVNGDCFSVTLLPQKRVMLSVADGKGHGSFAQRTSNLTMKLIEQFCTIGINADTTIESVNQVLSFNSSENFTAVDLCVVDCDSGEANFIKLGSTPTVIKRGGLAKAIVSEDLPLGVCKFAKCKISAEQLLPGDTIVMASDGVFDCFGDIKAFAGYINNENIINMDELAKRILNEAIRRNNGKVADDLTCLTFRLLSGN